MKIFKKVLLLSGVLLLNTVSLFASEADLAIPDLHNGAPYALLGNITPFDHSTLQCRDSFFKNIRSRIDPCPPLPAL